MTTIATVLSNPRVFMNHEGKDRSTHWHVTFDVKQSGWDGVRLSTGGQLLDLPTKFTLRAGEPFDPTYYYHDAEKLNQSTIGIFSHWPATDGEYAQDEGVNIECVIPDAQLMRVIESIERGRPPIAASFNLPQIDDGWGGGRQWEVEDKHTWREIDSVYFVFDPEPEADEPASSFFDDEPVPVPTDPRISAGLAFIRADLAKYALGGGAMFVALIAAVLWRG